MFVQNLDNVIVAYCHDGNQVVAPQVAAPKPLPTTEKHLVQRVDLMQNIGRIPYAMRSIWPTILTTKKEVISTLNRLQDEYAELGLPIPVSNPYKGVYGKTVVYHTVNAWKLETANGTVDKQRNAGYLILHDVAAYAAAEQGYENGFIPYSLFHTKLSWAIINKPKTLKIYTVDYISNKEWSAIRRALANGINVDVIKTTAEGKEVIHLKHVAKGTHPLSHVIKVPVELKQRYWALKFQYNDRIQPRVNIQMRKVKHLKWRPESQDFEPYVISREEERLREQQLKAHLEALDPIDLAYLKAFDLVPATLTHPGQIQEALTALQFYKENFELPEDWILVDNLPVKLPGDDVPAEERLDILAMVK